jgi:parallel beta-helix repeat protein
MRRVASKALIATLALASLLALNAGQALATHVSCGDTITQDTTLDSDLIDCPGNGIVIGADNITLDLNGHTITGVATGFGTGILGSRTGVTVEGGKVGDFQRGVELGSYGLARHLRVSNTGVGLSLFDADMAFVTENTLLANELGIALADGVENRIEANRLSRNITGINATCEVECGIGQSNSITRNLVLGGASGIVVVEADGNSVEGNTVARNDYFGIDVTDSENVRVLANDASTNLVGIFTQISLNVLVSSNSASRNREDGIVIFDNNSGTSVLNNSAERNRDDGIDVRSPATTLAQNHAHRNGDLGIEAVEGVIDGGGNKAFGNGNPLQCLNVVCR